jgi:ABC-type uncharacterized transport system substrate-binding protein
MKTTQVKGWSSILTSVCAFIIILASGCHFSSKPSAGIRIDLIQYNDSPLSELSRKGIEDGLAAAGMIEGKDFSLKVYNAQGDISTLNMLFDSAINDKPQLIFVTSTPTLQVAVKKVKNIPVVFTVVADPVLAGAGDSFSSHKQNITGISTLSDVAGMMRLLKSIVPGVKKIGTIYTPAEINSVRNMEDLKKHSEEEGIELITVPVTSSSEVMNAAMSLCEKQPEIVCQIVDNLTSGSISGVVKVCRDHKIPIFGFVSDQAEKGAVAVVSRDYHQAGLDAAILAKKILDGKSPAELPFEYVSKTNILINTVAAQRYNITVPADVLKGENVLQTGEKENQK